MNNRQGRTSREDPPKPVGQKAENETLNILWIVSDDLGLEIGAYGNDLVYTPYMDQLAREGTRYENFYTVSPVCSPSRSAFITGLYPTQIQSHHHRTMNPQPLPDSILLLPEYFREKGYFVFNQDSRDSSKAGKEDYNFQTDFQYDGTDWTQRVSGQPFFGQIQIFYPHRPFVEDKDRPVDLKQVTLPPVYPDHLLARRDWALYLESVQAMDEAVGKIVARLKKEGLYEKTILIFFGDHGRPHVWDKQFLYNGGIHAPLIIRHPRAKQQGITDAQLISSIDLVPTTLHLAGIEAPSFLPAQNFWSNEEPERTYIYAQRDRCGDAEDRIRAVRDKRFKYILNLMPEKPYAQLSRYKRYQYPVYTLLKILHAQGKLTSTQALRMASQKPPVELYDLQNDPDEVHNLADDPAYKAKQIKLRQTLDSCLLRYDKAYRKEPLSYTQAADRTSYKHYARMLQKQNLSSEVDDRTLLNFWKKHLGAEHK